MKYRVARFRVRPDAFPAAREIIQTFVEAIAEHEPGALRYESYVDKDGVSFTHLMAFENSEAEDAHRNSSHVSELVGRLYPLCDEEPVFRELTPVSGLGAQDLRVRNVHHKQRFHASAEQVFHALMDERAHAAFTGLPARIEARAGGAFATCGERNLGYTLELVPNRRIVQAWRHKDWPEGTWSTVTFSLHSAGTQTELGFTQTGVPTEAHVWIEAGWRSTYWSALERWLAEGRPLGER